MAMNMEINTPRGQSTNSSTNSSRATLVHSNTLSTAYIEYIQALNNNPTWADQVKINESQGFILSYTTPKIGKNNNANKAIAIENRPEPHGMGVADINTNTCQP